MSVLRVVASMAIALASWLPAPARAAQPSRAPVKGCAWEQRLDAGAGIEAWIQRCDFGWRKIDFVTTGHSLAVRYDGGAPEALVDVLELNPAEAVQAGLRRLFAEHTDAAIAAQCVLKPYRYYKGAPHGVRRYTFVPNATLHKTLGRTRSADEVGDPACGDRGDAPDGIQYFEVQPQSVATRRVLFVRIGQDEPLFDEQSLKVVR